MVRARELGARYLRTIYIDTKRIPWYDRFFSVMKFDSVDNLLSAIEDMHVDLDDIASSNDLKRDGVRGWTYWFLYIKGYLQYLHTNTVRKGNIYYDYLTQYFDRHNLDAGLAQTLGDPLAATERMKQRYQDFDFFRSCVAQDLTRANALDPVTIVVIPDLPIVASDLPPKSIRLIYEVGSDTPLQATMIDGNHRLFLARLFSVEQLRCEVFQESY
jgi:hypothetical protein